MLNYHNSQFTPDEICADFRRVLRERATSHSRFYHRLSTTSPAIRGLPEQNNNGDGDQRNNIDFDTDYIEIIDRDNNDGEKDKIDKNEILLANLSAQQPLSPITGLSSTLSMLSSSAKSSSPSPPLLCDYMPFVNHRPTKVNVNGIELVDRFNSSTTSMTSAREVSPTISQFEAFSSMEKSLNCTSNSTEIAAIARPPNEQVAREADSSARIIADGYLNDCRNQKNCDGDSCDGDADDDVNIRPAGDHSSSSDSNKAKRKACVCEFVDDDDVDNKSSHAINNNNKTWEQHSSDRSDYSTFVRTASLDRAINSTRLRRCSCLSCCCCCSCTHRAASAAEEFTSDSSAENGSRSGDSFCGEESGDRVIDDRSKSVTVCERQHQRVEESPFQQQYSDFPCVDKLVKMYTKLLQDKKSELKSSGMEDSSGTGDGDKSKAISDVKECDIKLAEGLQISMNRASPLSDEGCPLAGSPCSSDYEDNNETDLEKNKEKVLRSSSNDSALDLDDELPMESPPVINTGRRMTLTVTDIPLRPALLPVAEPHSLPDSTQLVLDQQQQQSMSGSASGPPTAIPSKVILEERIVEIPEDKVARSVSNSRRESAQSCLSDFNPSECNSGVRYVRTPSVVVSDYSDDVLSCGVTLEEIEYFRAHRMRRRSSADTNLTEKDDVASDVSAASSCSNLDYCGSTISGLDGNEYFVNGERVPIDRKVSDCSTCSTVSGDDEDDAYVIRDDDYNNGSSLRKDSLTAEEKKRPIKKVRHPKFIN